MNRPTVTQAQGFRRTRSSDLTAYRGRAFQLAHLAPMQIVRVLRGFIKGATVR